MLKMKADLTMHKIALLILSLSFISCATLPPFPEVEQCGYSKKFNKFRCVDTETRKARNVRLDDPSMEGAQCLNLKDYQASEAWVSTVKDIAEKNCH